VTTCGNECPRFQQFGDLVISRVLPAFDGINEEAHALERRRYEELISSVHVADEDDMWSAGARADVAPRRGKPLELRDRLVVSLGPALEPRDTLRAGVDGNWQFSYSC
jgi:hypothetical protein